MDGGNIPICVLSGNHILRIVLFLLIGIRQHFSQHPADSQPRLFKRATARILAGAPPQASVLFWWCRLGGLHSQPLLGWRSRKLSLSASLYWAEEAIKRHARNSDGDAAIIEVLSYPLYFRSRRLVVVAHGRSSCWHKWACERHD